jgi:hypothetical protein
MAGVPTQQWNQTLPHGVAPSRMAVPLLNAPHHGLAVASLPDQRNWLATRLYDLGASDAADMLHITTVARQKPHRA